MCFFLADQHLNCVLDVVTSKNKKNKPLDMIIYTASYPERPEHPLSPLAA
jgi:hypothetical protein